ncbi:hypothetical protein CLV84_0304 [Neolewinella xylanilytica]|uniref:YCII-related domain-containing protein n=1 Tax=Neolewinella xylanilytica TaxID=1514080 RepID=A0A2S6I781_9BACT|nr:YciI family protein [Neolewinella xylanilytica]PPK87364.1 hypothetical protein CLV84_0304 [Neolewinella xylanilytica]
MKEFLMLFWNTAGDRSYSVDAAAMQDSMTAWRTWIGKIARGGNLISTQPIRYEGATVDKRQITDRPAVLEGKLVTGYLLCRAASLEEAKEWAQDCPITTHATGFTEIREIAPFEM